MRGSTEPGPLAWLRLRWFDRRLDRIWRRGQVEHALSELRARAGATALMSARAVAADSVCVAEVAWLDGFCVRLRSCHPGAVAELARLLGDGQAVTLSRAARSGSVWSLDFTLGDRSFPLLARVVEGLTAVDGVVEALDGLEQAGIGAQQWCVALVSARGRWQAPRLVHDSRAV